MSDLPPGAVQAPPLWRRAIARPDARIDLPAVALHEPTYRPLSLPHPEALSVVLLPSQCYRPCSGRMPREDEPPRSRLRQPGHGGLMGQVGPLDQLGSAQAWRLVPRDLVVQRESLGAGFWECEAQEFSHIPE